MHAAWYACVGIKPERRKNADDGLRLHCAMHDKEDDCNKKRPSVIYFADNNANNNDDEPV